MSSQARAAALNMPLLSELGEIVKTVDDELAFVADTAYRVQDNELAARASATIVRTSTAYTFPSTFVDDSRYWVSQNGETALPASAVNFQLPGTFVPDAAYGRAYITEAEPADDNSLAPLGVVIAAPGTRILAHVRLQALSALSNGAVRSLVGLGAVGFRGDGSGATYLDAGTVLDKLLPGAGVVDLKLDYTVPADAAFQFLRPRVFYNYTDNAAHGNQQFKVLSFSTAVIAADVQEQLAVITGRTSGVENRSTALEGRATAVEARATAVERRAQLLEGREADVEARTQVLEAGVAPTAARLDAIEKKTALPKVFVLAGNGNFAVPAGARRLRIRMKGAGGGGQGSGQNGGPGTDGTNSTFGELIAGGGKRGAVRTGGVATGGLESRPGQDGGTGPGGGYSYHPGGKGGGALGTVAVGSTTPVPALDGGGGGGGGVNEGPSNNFGSGGGEGAEISLAIIDNPTAAYPYSVGVGGEGGVAGAGGVAGGKAGNGRITVEVIF